MGLGQGDTKFHADDGVVAASIIFVSQGPEGVCNNLDEWSKITREPEDLKKTFCLATGISTARLLVTM